VVYGLEGRSTWTGDGLAGVEVCCVRVDEGIAGDGPNERGEDRAVAAFRTLNHGGRVPSGGSGKGDVYLGKVVTVPPAGTPFLNEAVLGDLSLVADGVRLSVVR
jgi:hypothetical protein